MIAVALPEPYLYEVATAIDSRLSRPVLRWDIGIPAGRQALERGAPEVAVLVLGNAELGTSVRERFPALLLVQRWGTGLDNLDTSALRHAGIELRSLPGVNAASVAEHFWALALGASRQVAQASRRLAAGEWCQDDVGARIRDVAGATLGLIGLGAIGDQVARLGLGLGIAEVLYTKRGRVGAVPDGCRAVSLAEALSADLVGVVCDLNPTTRALLDRDRLALMKPDAILVNVARGEIVVEADLLQAWEAGEGPGIYACDVMASEPFEDRRLLGDPRVIATPHVAGRSPAARRALTDAVVASLAAFQGED